MRQLWLDFKQRPLWRKVLDIVVGGFALAGVCIIGAWLFFMLGGTRQHGGVDANYRYLMSVGELESMNDAKRDPVEVQRYRMEQYVRLAVLSRYYPVNAQHIAMAMQNSADPYLVNRMVAAAEVYIDDADAYRQSANQLVETLRAIPQKRNGNVIPWMNTVEWEQLRPAILRDSAYIIEAGRLTGVEPRLIAACLVGEQIRLFNSKRELVKKYLGPVKMLSVQSKFSFGVNGVKIATAQDVEAHLTDSTSPFYMGRHYEHLLDFEDADHEMERYNRLVDYRNHLYSYIYTGCILHQTMLQWRRAGYDISDRPDILFTLFNVGFDQSRPKPDPVCGGSHITVDDRVYTFGAIGFDFYYSGEMVDVFPFWKQRFITDDGVAMTDTEIQSIQQNVSDCRRPTADSTADTNPTTAETAYDNDSL